MLNAHPMMASKSPPLQIGKYMPIAELGRGGMADVYLSATHGPAGFRKLLVVKKLRATLADDPEFVSMLLDEARIAARLNHPNVVQTYEVGSVDGEYFIAMEYLEGQPLHRLIRRSIEKASYDSQMQYGIIADVLAGLHHAHELADYDGAPLAIVHRDISPHNIFVTYDGQVKVVDFGIAKAAGRISAATREGVVKGKMRYMAPEQALGHDVDRRADIFSVGVLLWTAATGERFWNGLDEIAIITRLIGRDIPGSPRAVRPEVPEEVDRICKRALCGDPLGRYATAFEMQSEIESYLAASGGKPAARNVGSLVSTLFAKERADVRDIVEHKLTELASPDSNYKLASITSVVESSESGSSQNMSKARFVRERAIALAAREESVGQREAAASAAGGRELRSSEPTRTLEASEITFDPTSPGARARTKSRVPVAVFAGGFLAILAVAIFFAIRRMPARSESYLPSAPASTVPNVVPAATAEGATGSVEALTRGTPSALTLAPPTSSPLNVPVKVVRGAQSAASPRNAVQPLVVPNPGATVSASSGTPKPPALPPHETDDGLSTRK